MAFPLLIPEIVSQVFSYLDLQTSCLCAQVCRTWNREFERIQQSSSHVLSGYSTKNSLQDAVNEAVKDIVKYSWKPSLVLFFTSSEYGDRIKVLFNLFLFSIIELILLCIFSIFLIILSIFLN